MFSIQVDESTDVALCSQLLVFVRYIHMEDVKEEFLYCKALETSATAQDVMDSISNFFDIEGLQWEKLCGVCTDGAPTMLGCKSGFQMKVKEKSPEVRGVKLFCILLNHETLLYCTAVRSLSKRNVVTRFLELRTEIKLFLEMIEKDAFVDFFKDETWLQGLAYLADITEQINKFNLRLQGPDTNTLQFGDILRGFIEKIDNWKRRVNQENFAMFENLSNFESGLSSLIKQEITEHLQSLENEFEKYFPDLEEGSDVFPRNPFSVMIDIATIPEEV